MEKTWDGAFSESRAAKAMAQLVVPRSMPILKAGADMNQSWKNLRTMNLIILASRKNVKGKSPAQDTRNSQKKREISNLAFLRIGRSPIAIFSIT
jgi:hypothetical protein